jgi:type II secretory pathway predicted ATPase ExeA/tetratricopeptide (TPR) repeat protein
MYTSFYKLKEMPFTLGTDPRFLWLGDKHREALAHLNYGLVEADGYVVLTGDVGVGKTTLVNALLESVDDSILTVNLSHPTLSIMEFFHFLAKAWDGPRDLANKAEFLFFFEDSLQKTHAEGKRVLLIIDEAHKLSEELLEEIRLLSNIEHHGIRLITIFFVGQNELKDILLNPQFRALRQRITLFYDIKPLSSSETATYIKHRLQIAGGDGDIFSAEAMAAVYAFSKGYPRLINTLCGRSMLTGFISEKQKIDAAIVRECSKELDFLDPTSVSRQIESNQTPAAPAPAQEPTVPQRPLPTDFTSQGESSPTVQVKKLKSKDKAEEKIQRSLRLLQGKTNLHSYWRSWLPLHEHAGKVVVALVVLGILGFYLIQERTGPFARFEMEDEKVAEAIGNQDISAKQEQVSRDTAPIAEPASAEKMEDKNATAAESVQDETPMVTEEKGEMEKVAQEREEKKTENAIQEKAEVASVSAPSEESAPPEPEKGQHEIAAESAADKAPKITKETKRVETAVLVPEKSSVEIDAQGTRDVPPLSPPPTTIELAIAALENRQYQIVIDLLEAEKYRLEGQDEMYAVLYASALIGKAELLMPTYPQEAKVLLRQVVETEASNSRAYFLLGKLHTQDKEYAPAINAYLKATRLNPTFPDSFFNLGFLYATTGMYEEAEKYFKRTIELEPDYLGKALFNLAVIQERLGKKEESLINLRRASGLDPENQKVKDYLQRAQAK